MRSMAGRIPQQFIDELMTRVDIVDVIDSHVPLRKKGKDYMACCPFHNEKTPSFSVSREKQFYYCFGCGASGTALGFLMDYEHMDFLEAVSELAAGVGMEVPKLEAGPSTHGEGHADDTRPLYGLMVEAAAFFRRQLREHPQATHAIDYLKQRGLSGEIAAEFGIGFAPPGWDNVLKALGATPVRQQQLAAVGLVVEKDGGKRYDRFRDRIMFPIVDRRGRTVGFGGRVLGDDEPKYLNSPETPLFHKGRELYGLYQALKALRHPQRLVVVEGYMDVVALAQFGIHYAVATLGTATTREHLERLFRAAPEVVFCFDGDRAGREAAWRALENALPVMREGRQVGFVFLPEGEDPDSLVRSRGHEAFEALVIKPIPFSAFLYDNLQKQVDMNSIDGRARLAELARPLLAKLPQGVFRDMLTARLAELTQMEAARLDRYLASPSAAPALTPTHAPTRSETGRKYEVPLVRRAITLLLQRPGLASYAEKPTQLRGLDLAGITLLVDMLELLHEQPHLTTAALVEHWRETKDGQHLAKLTRWQPGDGTDMEAEFRDTVQRLQRLQVEQRTKVLISKERAEGLTAEEKQEFRRLLHGES